MFAKKTPQKLMLYAFLFFLTFFGLIRIFSASGGYFFQLELMGLLFLLLLTFIGFIFYRTWGERVFLFVFLFYLINLILIWYFFNSLYLTLIILAVIGFLLSIPVLKCRKRSGIQRREQKRSTPEEPHSEVFETEQSYGESKIIETPKKVNVKRTETKFSPGKYVASKNSNTFHEPKCDWAKKIAPLHRIWFKTKADAWEMQYKAHDCVK